jgi:iron complex outermembrane recepter protein
MRRELIAAISIPLAYSFIFTPAQAAENMYEEIVITAQHRKESAQKTPISLVTFGAEQLEKQRITSINNLNGLVPNLSIDSFPANNQSLRLFIRGVGLTDTQITQDAAVGVYLNGAYIARSTGLAFDVADLERIEVLRGPQGTLYGRNTTGGAIKLITKKPDVDTFSFDQTLSTGNQDLFSGKTSVNIPMAERYGLKLAYFYEDVAGFTDNGGPGGDWGDRKSEGYRLDFRANIGEFLTLDYSYDKSDIEYYNLTAQAVVPRASGNGLLSIVGDVAQQYVPFDSNRLDTLSTTTPLLPTDTSIDGHTLNLDWTISDNLSLRSITAWRELDDKSYVDFAGGSAEGFRIDFNDAVIGANAGEDRIDLAANRPHLEQEQFSQEFHLLGNINHSIEYLAGVYYFYEKAEEDITPRRHIFSSFPFPAAPSEDTLYNIGSEYNEIENEAWAFFSQFTWTPDILDQKLQLTVGWRHSEDSRDAMRVVVDETVVDQGTAVIHLLPPTEFFADTGEDYSDDSFNLKAEYDWTEDFYVYGIFSEAYKSGGFNIRDPDEEGFSNGFDEEKLRSVEAGFKGEILHGRLRLNGSFFHQRFDDFQYNFQIPGTIQGSRVFNVDEGEMGGMELEIVAMPIPAVFVHFSYAYLDADLDDIISPLTGELTSANFANAPEHTLSLMADFSFPIDWGLININASYNFVDDRNENNERTYRDAYDLFNARIALTNIYALEGEWSVSLWGKNLQDSDYESFVLDNLPHAERAVIWGDGRTYGLDVAYHFE